MATTTSSSSTTDRWLQSLGYDGSVGVLHRREDDVPADHPYARELALMLKRGGDIGSSAVFEVDHVPAVCFIDAGDRGAVSAALINEVRRKIWNQNLVAIILVIEGDEAHAYAAPRQIADTVPLHLNEASVTGPFSAADIATGDIYTRLPRWFERKHCVDRVLLDNLGVAVDKLCEEGLTKDQAQLVLGKCIFVSYLEDREIVADEYRAKNHLLKLAALLKDADAKGLDRLFRQLKSDLNGDMLEIEGGANVDWRNLNVSAFDLLARFLTQTDLISGQQSFWPYDFKYIPVELVSGIYETFLGEHQVANGAVYTPRHLASLAVEEAFRDIKAPWKEVVLDGACGSGILLTTAYRRMLGAARAAQLKPLTYEQRQQILLDGIRGGDISLAACKVTAFSLYLALLEDLAPSDIAKLQADHQVKLPKLLDKIISTGAKGDFFAANHPAASTASASIVISNPPWNEPEDTEELLPYEVWWKERFGTVLPRRQIALAFARRATDALKAGGRLCLIMPVSTLGAANAGSYLRSWFEELQPERIFNLADLRFVLFDTAAIHPTALVTGVRRATADCGRIPAREAFDYLVPKADIALAFGRLTVHSSDRKRLFVHAACQDAEVLRTYFWGNELDEALIARLRLSGTIHDHTRGDNARFVACKGFHLTDNAKASVSPGPLKSYRFMSTARGASRYPKDRFFIGDHDLVDFPRDITHVADHGSKDGQAFDGVRVLFPDGADSRTLEVRACFTQQPLCFTQTVGAIIDREGDAQLMKFLTVYLRSRLARYLLFYTTFSLAMERPHVKMKEIANLPFPLPDEHINPKHAINIIEEVSELLKPFRQVRDVLGDADWVKVRGRLEELVFDYFGVSATERRVVNETCDYFIPSRQPTSFAVLRRPLAGGPTVDDTSNYVRILKKELESWRDRFDGEGRFQVAVTRGGQGMATAPAVVRLRIAEHSPMDADAKFDGMSVLLDALKGEDIYPNVHNDAYSLASDFLVHRDGDLYLVKPMIKRLWLAGAAAHDAFRVVQAVRGTSQVQ
ncbi:MAG: N-6 DNA methylase [Rhodocyclaceae bacterium]|jgi:hypothetical protein|nr:N-6 DNA methylase [Rhodocyclaceae bacterium]MCE2724330.1 SAM-dependent methyltransferase [Betaproteobacteria bacterium]MCA3024582.1 N-6 DNA methylase [Rhodocyclaceae bacterium]MCA3027777.1 N-6 DNA methylase [Rhodocyclaceae bacterium]MCA3033467.1 N-6 DNA methylase [Rhodocyclaceae bacterium]